MPTDFEKAKEIAKARAVARSRALAKAQSMSQPRDSLVNTAIHGSAAGVAGLAGLPVDTVENAVNLGLAGVGTVANMAGRPDLAPELLEGSFGGSRSIMRGMESIGIKTQPTSNDPASRAAYAAGRVIGGSPAGPRATLPAAGGAATGAAIDPRLEAVGAMTPSAARAGAVATKEALVPAQTQQNIQTFNQAGTTPSVGQATGIPFFQGVENFLGKMPGGGPLKQFKERQQADIGSGVPSGSAEKAGRVMEKGFKSFLDRTSTTWKALDDDAARKIGNASVAPTKTLEALDKITTGKSKAEQGFINPRLTKIKEDLEADLKANNGEMSFEAMRSLRSRVGQLVDDSLVAGIPQGELRALYKGLTEDMSAAAKTPEAKAAWARQNDYYRARMDRVEGALNKVLGKDRMPEEIFAAANPKNVEQANLLRQTLRSLRPDERKVVTEAVVGRLGRATPGRQDETGTVFSTDTFLKNYNKLSPGAKQQLFADDNLRRDLEHIAKTAAKIEEASTVGQNYSGTAGQVFQGLVLGGAGYGVVSMNPAVVAGAAAAPVVVNLTSRLMTNPKFVKWLAQSTRVQPEALGTHMARLAVIYNTADEDTKKDLEAYAASLQ